MSFEISVAFQTDKRASEYVRLAKLVNEYDFDAVTVYCDLPFHPSFMPLALMAPHITRARVGVSAVPPSRIPPLDIAANGALLEDLAPGRAYIGVSRGAWLEQHGIAEDAPPVTAIREAIEVVRYLWAGRTEGYQGRVYRLAPHVRAAYPLPERDIPILVGTWGEKLCAVAGELANEVKLGGSANPDVVPLIQRYIAVGERKAGRPVGSVGVVVGAVSVIDEDRKAAREAARRAVALYLPVVAPLDPTVHVEPELIERLRQHADRGEFDEGARLVSDDLLDKFAFSGDAHDLIEHGLRLKAAGAARVEFGTPHGLHAPDSGLRLLGERVLPALKREAV
ncbi:LLM class flavin-dependent oxidoreductase (plasmid) [Aggregatilineales bacterium SYSU G02658]